MTIEFGTLTPKRAAIAARYREGFVPSEALAAPRLVVCGWALCAETDEEAFVLLQELGMPFQRDGAPGATQTDEEAEAEEERRKEEARQRAEAEQAALEQLKEENPEAYEKPERPEEGEEGEEGDTGSEEE